MTDLNLKPRFNFIRTLFSSTMCCVFFIICLISIASVIAAPQAIPIILTIIAIIVLAIEFSVYMNYRATNYVINDDKIVFYEGFINHKTTSVKINNIKEVHLTQSFIQRIFQLGTIRLLTSGSNFENGGGINLRDIDSFASVYMLINKLLASKLAVNTDSCKSNKSISIKPASNTPYYTFIAVSYNMIFLAFLSIISIILSISLTQNFFIFFSISLGLAIATTFITTYLIKLEYSKRKYIISTSKIESKEGFFNYHYATVDFRNIREIRYESGFVQRHFALGSVLISTPSNNRPSTQVNESNVLAKLFLPNFTSGSQNKNMSYYRTGIKLSNMTDAIKIYKVVKQLHDNAINHHTRNITNDAPQYTYKPVFNIFSQPETLSMIAIVLLAFILVGVFGGAWIGGIVILIGITAIFGTLIYLDKKNYDCTKYEVYPSRIEFHEGFITNKSSMILIENIKEIHLKENFLQKIFHLGSIKMITAGTTNEIDADESGACFKNIKNCKEVYSQIREFITNKQHEPKQAVACANSSNINVAQTNTYTEQICEPDTNKINCMEIKPKYMFLNIFFSQFFIVFAVIFILAVLVILQEDNVHWNYIPIAFIISIIASIVVSTGICIFDGLNYGKTKYEFVKDRINFSEGFFNNNYTSVEYKNIREIIFQQNWVQKIFKVATIKCLTAANTGFSGLRLRDVCEPSTIYDKLKDNVMAYSSNSASVSVKIMECKPKFHFFYVFFCYGLTTFFISLLFLGAFLGFLAFIIAFIVVAIRYNSTKYILNSDTIISVFSFINTSKTTIFTSKLRETHLKQGFMQRIFKLGTFMLVTSASGGAGCKLLNVCDVQGVNAVLQKMVDENKNKI